MWKTVEKEKKVKAQRGEDKKKRNQIKPELGSVKFRTILEEELLLPNLNPGLKPGT